VQRTQELSMPKGFADVRGVNARTTPQQWLASLNSGHHYLIRAFAHAAVHASSTGEPAAPVRPSLSLRHGSPTGLKPYGGVLEVGQKSAGPRRAPHLWLSIAISMLFRRDRDFNPRAISPLLRPVAWILEPGLNRRDGFHLESSACQWLCMALRSDTSSTVFGGRKD